MSEPTDEAARTRLADGWRLYCSKCEEVFVQGREKIKDMVVKPGARHVECGSTIEWWFLLDEAPTGEGDALTCAEVIALLQEENFATPTNVAGSLQVADPRLRQHFGRCIRVSETEHGTVMMNRDNDRPTITFKSLPQLQLFIAGHKARVTDVHDAPQEAQTDLKQANITLNEAVAYLQGQGLELRQLSGPTEAYDIWSQVDHLGVIGYSQLGAKIQLVACPNEGEAFCVHKRRDLSPFLTTTQRPHLRTPLVATQVDDHGGFSFNAVSTHPADVFDWVFPAPDTSKSLKSYVVSGESGAGKSTLAATLIPRCLGAKHTVVYSLSEKDREALRFFADNDDSLRTRRRRILTRMYSEQEVNQFVGDHGARNSRAKDILIETFRTACESACDTAKTPASEMVRWLNSSHRVKLGRTVFVIDEVGRGLPFAAAVVGSLRECVEALQAYCTEVYLVFCGTTAESVSRLAFGDQSSLIVTDPSLVHAIRILPQRDQSNLQKFVKSRLDTKLKKSGDVDDEDIKRIMAQCDSPLFQALWSNPRLAMQWVIHLCHHLCEPSNEVPAYSGARLCALDARCSANHAARDYPNLNGLKSLPKNEREQVCDFAYVMLCRLYSPYRDNQLYWHLRQSGWPHADASCFSSNFVMKASEDLRKLLLRTDHGKHALHFAIYFVLKKMGLTNSTTKISKLDFSRVEGLVTSKASRKALSEAIKATASKPSEVDVGSAAPRDAPGPGVNTTQVDGVDGGASAPSEVNATDLATLFQRLLKFEASHGDTPITDLFQQVVTSNTAPWETFESTHWLYPSSMLEDKKAVNELLDKCLQLGLLFRTEGGAVEASPGLCLALCSDFGQTEAFPTDGTAFEAIVARGYMRRGRLEGLNTRLFHLREPLPQGGMGPGASALIPHVRSLASWKTVTTRWQSS